MSEHKDPLEGHLEQKAEAKRIARTIKRRTKKFEMSDVPLYGLAAAVVVSGFLALKPKPSSVPTAEASSVPTGHENDPRHVEVEPGDGAWTIAGRMIGEPGEDATKLEHQVFENKRAELMKAIQEAHPGVFIPGEVLEYIPEDQAGDPVVREANE